MNLHVLIMCFFCYLLFRQPYWQFEIPNAAVKTVKGCTPHEIKGQNSSTCIFYFSICHPVPRYCPENSGICLANKFSFNKDNTTLILYTAFTNTGSFSEKFTSGLTVNNILVLVNN